MRFQALSLDTHSGGSGDMSKEMKCETVSATSCQKVLKEGGFQQFKWLSHSLKFTAIVSVLL